MTLDLPVRDDRSVAPVRGAVSVARTRVRESDGATVRDFPPACAVDVLSLSDRRVPISGAVLDQVVIGAAGVFVVATERVPGGRVQLRRAGRLFRPRREQLVLAGRERCDIVHSLQWQMSTVRSLLVGTPFEGASVTALLCAIDARPFRPFVLGGVHVGGVNESTRKVVASGPYGVAARAELLRALDDRLRPAHT